MTAWVTQPGWILTFEGVLDEGPSTLAIVVVNHADTAAVERLKELAREHRRKNGRKSRPHKTPLKWDEYDGTWASRRYAYYIVPFTIEVLT